MEFVGPPSFVGMRTDDAMYMLIGDRVQGIAPAGQIQAQVISGITSLMASQRLCRSAVSGATHEVRPLPAARGFAVPGTSQAVGARYGCRGRSGDPEHAIKSLLVRNQDHLSGAQ